MTRSLGSPKRPLRVAVVGSGPAGMYAAAALLAPPNLTLTVDVLERLPAPFGLVRYGVAPDHQKIKGVQRVFDRTLDDPRVRYLGNVELGRDVSRPELKESYHQVVYAVGAQGDRRLGIPGEDLDGSWSSTEFVNWYNGHPDRSEADYPLDGDAVAVVGIGNVALDVARILATDWAQLAGTDISDRALETLRQSRVRDVHLLARRGPVQAKCSPSELKELAELEAVAIEVDAAALDLDSASEAALESDRSAAKNLELLRQFAIDLERVAEPRCRLHLHFLVSPRELYGVDGRVRAIRCERNELVAMEDGYLNARGTGSTFELPVARVIRAIGYRSNRLVDLPYDERRGIVPNREGRIVDGSSPLVGEYVVGWIKRGPSGLIGSNKSDARSTVDAMLEDLEQGAVFDPIHDGVGATLRSRGHRVVDRAAWRRIEALENQQGKEQGRPRVKLLTVESMLGALDP